MDVLKQHTPYLWWAIITNPVTNRYSVEMNLLK